MKTSSFHDYPTGPGRISIARSVPRQFAAGYRVFYPLAPGKWFNDVPRAEYERRYYAQLSALDPFETVNRLHALAGDAEPVLLCWEKKCDCNAGTHWCHRHMVAKWLRETMQMTIIEA